MMKHHDEEAIVLWLAVCMDISRPCLFTALGDRFCRPGLVGGIVRSWLFSHANDWAGLFGSFSDCVAKAIARPAANWTADQQLQTRAASAHVMFWKTSAGHVCQVSWYP